MGLSKTNIGTTPDGKPLFHVSGNVTDPEIGTGPRLTCRRDVVAVITWNADAGLGGRVGFGVEVLPAA